MFGVMMSKELNICGVVSSRRQSHLGVAFVLLLSLLAVDMVDESVSTAVVGNCTIAPPAVMMVVSIADERVPGMRVGT